MEDTIAAIATAYGEGGIGIIRISGPETKSILEKVFKGKIENRRMSYGHVVDPADGSVIDEVLSVYMKEPHTYTREDVAEINCHGSMVSLRKTLEVVIRNGARLAEPGEFTKRAFLNGKIDLSQAEAVIDIINSKNEYALKSSISQLKGTVHNKIEKIRKEIIYHTAFIETALDDPEHISVDGYGDKLKNTVQQLIKEIDILIKSSENQW